LKENVPDGKNGLNFDFSIT